MKKISYIAISFISAAIPMLSMAATSYTITPSNNDDTQTPVAGSVATALSITCDQLNAFTYKDTGAPLSYVETACGTDVLMVNSTSDILSGARIYSTGEDIDCTGQDEAYCSANAAETITISTQAAAAGLTFSVPSEASSQLLALLGDQIADTGTIAIIGVSAAVYLAFYVMQKIIAMLQPKRAENDKDVV